MHCLSHTCAQPQDIFGILTTGNEWGFYRFQHGSPEVHFEYRGLSVHLGQKRDRYADEVEPLLSAVVGVLAHLVRDRQESRAAEKSRQEGSAVKRARTGAGAYPSSVPALAVCAS